MRIKKFKFCFLVFWILSTNDVMAFETISFIPPHIQYVCGTNVQPYTATCSPKKYTQITCDHEQKHDKLPKHVNTPDKWAMLMSAIGKHMYEILSSSLVEFNNLETSQQKVFYRSKSIMVPGTTFNDTINAFYLSIQDNKKQHYLNTLLQENETGVLSWITLPDNFRQIIRKLFDSETKKQKIGIQIFFYDGTLSSKNLELVYDKTKKIFNELSRLKLKYAIINYLKSKHYPPESDNND